MDLELLLHTGRGEERMGSRITRELFTVRGYLLLVVVYFTLNALSHSLS